MFISGSIFDFRFKRYRVDTPKPESSEADFAALEKISADRKHVKTDAPRLCLPDKESQGWERDEELVPAEKGIHGGYITTIHVRKEYSASQVD